MQLRKLSEWVEIRRKHAAMLSACFADLAGLRVTTPPDHIGHAYYKYYVFVNRDALGAGWSRDRILNEIDARGGKCFSGSCSEVYLEKAFPPEWRPKDRLPIARELGETSLMFLVDPSLSEAEISNTCDIVKQVMGEATR
jgi:dTDP-4-amino-4,6-dideoxygalactose transaminase